MGCRTARGGGEEREMQQRHFGTSGLSVSVLSFGTIMIGGRDRFGKMDILDV
jgi:aryl-alcohol dehydrogenase-like predicted oxidoreductase